MGRLESGGVETLEANLIGGGVSPPRRRPERKVLLTEDWRGEMEAATD